MPGPSRYAVICGATRAPRARYQIGLIQLERFFDTDGALKSFEAVERELPGTQTVSYEVALKIGQTLVITQDTAGAAMRFRSVISALHSTPDQQDEAIFRLAELEYFRGQFKEATSRLEGLTVNLKADYANDALQLLAFLQENTASASGALRDYSGASYLIRQRKISEAIPILESIVKRYASAPLVDDALMTLAGLQADIGQERELFSKTHASDTSCPLSRPIWSSPLHWTAL